MSPICADKTLTLQIWPAAACCNQCWDEWHSISVPPKDSCATAVRRSSVWSREKEYLRVFSSGGRTLHICTYQTQMLLSFQSIQTFLRIGSIIACIYVTSPGLEVVPWPPCQMSLLYKYPKDNLDFFFLTTRPCRWFSNLVVGIF